MRERDRLTSHNFDYTNISFISYCKFGVSSYLTSPLLCLVSCVCVCLFVFCCNGNWLYL
jgi:hypothetical protein